MPGALSSKKRLEMFLAYCQTETIDGVKKLCNVHWLTAKKYKEIDKWDKRLAELKRKALKREEDKVVKRLKENLEIVRFAKNRLYEKIKSGEDKTASTYADLDRLIRLEQFLEGGPDSRPVHQIEITYVDAGSVPTEQGSAVVDGEDNQPRQVESQQKALPGAQEQHEAL